MSLLGETRNILQNINYSPKSSPSVKTVALKTASLLESMEEKNPPLSPKTRHFSSTSQNTDKSEQNSEASETIIETVEGSENLVESTESSSTSNEVNEGENTYISYEICDDNIEVTDSNNESVGEQLSEPIEDSYRQREVLELQSIAEEIIEDFQETLLQETLYEEIQKSEALIWRDEDQFERPLKNEVTLLTLETDRYLKIIPEEENIEDGKSPEIIEQNMEPPDFTIQETKAPAVRKTSSIERGTKSSLLMMKQLGKRIDDDPMTPEIIISEASELTDQENEEDHEKCSNLSDEKSPENSTAPVTGSYEDKKPDVIAVNVEIVNDKTVDNTKDITEKTNENAAKTSESDTQSTIHFRRKEPVIFFNIKFYK